MFDVVVLAYALSNPEQPTPTPPLAPDEATNETSFVGGFGAARGDKVGGMAIWLGGLHRIGFVEVGGELYGAVLFSGIGGIGGLAGLHLGDRFTVRALAAAGVHGYDGVGRGVLSDDPGVGGSLPYVGGRLMLGYGIGSKRSTFLGLAGMVDEDLGRETKSVTYESEDWFNGGTSEQTSHHTIGQTTWGALFLVGRQFDVAPY